MVSFTYDEQGLVSLYFLLTVALFTLIPLTYSWWPRLVDDEDKRLELLRSIHVDSKWFHKKVQQRRKKTSPLFTKSILMGLWAVFAFYAYKAAQIEVVKPDWDPYAELNVANAAFDKAFKKSVKSSYKKLSLKYHPDKCKLEDTEEKTGTELCEEKFKLIKQAKDILIEEDRKIVWDETGDTGETKAMEFGIALPSWIVDKENVWFVLGLYVICFMVILPTTVGRWWYKSIKFSSDAILLSTGNLFQYFIYQSPTMQFKRLIQILSSAHEFHRGHNKDVKERSSDVQLMPKLLAQLPQDNAIKKQANLPMNQPYAIKARALMQAHLNNIDLEKPLQEDQDLVLSKCTMLLHSMVQTMSEFNSMHNMGKLKKAPAISTMDATMKFSALLTQGIADGQNPIFQLPHLSDNNLSFLQKKKVKTLKALACLTDSRRRDLLKVLSDQQYDDLCNRLRLFPDVHMEVKVSVLDEEEEDAITAGSLVTISVNLKRKTLGDLMKQADEEGEDIKYDENSKTVLNFGNGAKAREWFSKKYPGPLPDFMKVSSDNPASKNKKKNKKKKKAVATPTADDDSDYTDIESEKEENLNRTAAELDEDDWQKHAEKVSKKEKQQSEDLQRSSHTVYTPRWPIEKQEHWWIYLCDQNLNMIFAPVQPVYSLENEKEVLIQFQAPPYPNIYKCKIVLRSDSYLDCDRTQDIRMVVSPGDLIKKVDANEVWGDLESEDDVVRVENSDDEDSAAEESDAGSWNVDSD